MRTILIALAVVTMSCRARPPKAPYARGAGPEPLTLLAANTPRYASLRVPKAKIREGRSPGARLQLRAEAPARMVGGIDVAGNPLVTLAMHEDGYALRTVRDAPGLAAGFYSGPPSDCAVRALLGVEIAPEQIVALLLGGGPVIDGPHEILERGWVKGRERLKISNDRYVEELQYAWVDGQWWFGGASLWTRRGGSLEWLWSIEHEGLEAERGSGSAAVLPAKTVIRRPKRGGGTVAVTIAYAEQVPGPVIADGANPGPLVHPPDDGGPDDGGPDDGGGDGGGDDGGWEDGWDEEGWGDEASPPAETTPSPVPAAYLLSASGLPDRGHLCR